MFARAISCLLFLSLAACGGAGGGADTGGGAGGGGQGGGGAGGLPSSDARLANLRISAGELTPAFSAVITDYSAEVGVFAAAIRVEPTAADPGATITVAGAPVDSGEPSELIDLLLGGDTTIEVIVTAEDGVTTMTYSTVVTRADPTTAAQEAYVKASNTEATDNFGNAIAIAGDTMVVGAPQEDSGANGVNGDQSLNGANNAGAAYVFVRDGGVWLQQAYLKASRSGTADTFGTSVAIAGGTIVVGAPGEASIATGVDGDQADNSAASAGAAYVFVRSGNTWSQQAYLKASNTTAGDQFGWSVGIAGDTIVVGAWNEDSIATGVNGNQINEQSPESGAAYVFVRNGGTWSQQAYLKASNTDDDDKFGVRVGISGETIVVGAFREDSNATGVNGDQLDDSLANSGAAYVFVRNGSTWSQEAYLKASNAGVGDNFGAAVAISLDTIVVGAYNEDSDADDVDGVQFDESAFNSGAAYVFYRTGSSWAQQAYLKSQASDSFDSFGYSVAIQHHTIVVGAYNEDSNAVGINGDPFNDLADGSGAAFVYARSGATWARRAFLKASNTQSDDAFGWAVDISDDTIVVGAKLEDSASTGVNGSQITDTASTSGAAYVLR